MSLAEDSAQLPMNKNLEMFMRIQIVNAQGRL